MLTYCTQYERIDVTVSDISMYQYSGCLHEYYYCNSIMCLDAEERLSWP